MKKILALLLVVFMGMGLLVGCGNEPAEESPAETNQPNDEETPVLVSPTILGMELSNLDLDGTLLDTYEGQTITIATGEGDFANALENQKVYFEQITGATVNVNTFPGESFMEKIQLDLILLVRLFQEHHFPRENRNFFTEKIHFIVYNTDQVRKVARNYWYSGFYD